MSPDSPFLFDYLDELTEKYYPEYDFPEYAYDRNVEWEDDWDDWEEDEEEF